MNVQEINEAIEKIDQRQKELRELLAPYQSELQTIQREREDLIEKRDILILEAKPINWEWLLKESLETSKVKNQFRRKKLEELGLSSAGYHPRTMQVIIQISLQKNSSYKKTLDGLIKILPHIKPIGGEKIICLFEHTLRKFGTYVLVVSKKKIYIKKYACTDAVYFPNLEKALDYIQQNHWYEESEEKESD